MNFRLPSLPSRLTRSFRFNRLPLAAVAALFTSFALVATPASAADPTNVTSVVAAAVKDNKLSINAGNETFGDTAQGVPKKLHVEYRIGARSFSANVNEGEQLDIAAPAGQKLVITKAIYGPADGSAPQQPRRRCRSRRGLGDASRLPHRTCAQSRPEQKRVLDLPGERSRRVGCCSAVSAASRSRA